MVPDTTPKTHPRLFERVVPAKVYGTRPPSRPSKLDNVARGTVEMPAHVPKPGSAMYEHNLGTAWFYSMRMEFLGRNIAIAGACETAYRLGLARDALERAGRK